MSHRSEDARDGGRDDGREDGLLARVGALPRPALDVSADNRIHTYARAAFAAAGTGTAERPAGGRRARWWNRTLEPAVVIAALAGYLVWTATTLAEINRGHERESATALQAAPPVGATTPGR